MDRKDTRAQLKIDPKVELKDYSGPFKPDLRYSDFSREQLARMYLMAQEYFLEANLAWSGHIAEKYGMEAMAEAHLDVWINRMSDPWHRIVTEGMGIKGNDIESFMKLLQTQLDWGPGDFDVTFEMLSKDRGVATCHYCKGVEMCEELGVTDLLQAFCNVDSDVMLAWAKLINPDIEINCLAMPPRKSKDDICCKWELTYKSK